MYNLENIVLYLTSRGYNIKVSDIVDFDILDESITCVINDHLYSITKNLYISYIRKKKLDDIICL